MWNEFIPEAEIKQKVTAKTVEFAEKFGSYLGTTDKGDYDSNGRKTRDHKKLTSSQLRKFFGEVKRQQMEGYDETSFVLLKPKLAYAVGRDTEGTKIDDFYQVISRAMDSVKDTESFNRFIQIFEAIVAYHKATAGKE